MKERLRLELVKNYLFYTVARLLLSPKALQEQEIKMRRDVKIKVFDHAIALTIKELIPYLEQNSQLSSEDIRQMGLLMISEQFFRFLSEFLSEFEGESKTVTGIGLEESYFVQTANNELLFTEDVNEVPKGIVIIPYSRLRLCFEGANVPLEDLSKFEAVLSANFMPKTMPSNN